MVKQLLGLAIKSGSMSVTVGRTDRLTESTLPYCAEHPVKC